MDRLKAAVLILVVFWTEKIDSEDTQIDLGDAFMDEIGKMFVSHLSEDLKKKLEEKAAADGPMDLDSPEYDDLSEDEKKEIEEAIKKAFQPIFGQFAEMVSKNGIPDDIFNTAGKVLDREKEKNQQDKTEDEKEEPIEPKSGKPNDKNDQQKNNNDEL